MQKILALFASLWHLIEDKNVFVSVLTAIASVAAYYKLNVPVALIITGVAGVMTALGVTSWQANATTTQETQMKLALLNQGVKHPDLHEAFLAAMGRRPISVRGPQSGRVRVKVMAALACVGLAGGGTMIVVATTTATVATVVAPGCAASNALGTCEVSVLEKQLPNSAGTIFTDLLGAIGNGGAAVAALVATIESVFPGTMACIGTFVDSLVSQYLVANIGSASTGSAAPAVAEKFRILSAYITDPAKARAGLAALHVELRKRNLPVVTTAVP